MTTKLTHIDFLNLGKLLGYPLSSGGLCRGFSGMMMQAWLAEDAKTFFARIKFIESYNKDFNKLKNDIENARKLVQSGQLEDLDEETRKRNLLLLEIPALFEGIELYLNPEKHTDLLNKPATQRDVGSINPFTRPISANENDDMTVVFEKSYAFDKKGLLAYLTDLEEQFENTDVIAPVNFSSTEHSICAKYSKTNKQWMFVDTNDFERYSDYEFYSSPVDKEKLVGRIFQSFDFGSEPCDHTIFTTTVVAKGSQSPALKAMFDGVSQRYPITPELVNRNNYENLNLLSIACQNNEVETVNALLELEGIRVNQASSEGFTPLYLACQNGHLQTLQALLTHKEIQINQATNYGTSPLNIACGLGHLEIVRALLTRADIQINQTNNDGKTALFEACAMGELEIVQELLKNPNIDVNQGTSTLTPIVCACLLGHYEIVDELLKHPKVEINRGDRMDATLLHYACMYGHTEVVKSIENSNRLQNIDAQDKRGLTPLMYACKSQGNKDKKALFECLLQQGASLLLKDRSRKTPLDHAFESKNKAAMESILDHAAAHKINIRSIVNNQNYKGIQDVIVVYEREKRFQKQLEKADVLLREGELLLAKNAQMSSMTLKNKENYLAEIKNFLSNIEASHIFDPTEQNNLPNFNDKIGLIHKQIDDLEKIELSIENEIDQAQRKEIEKQEESFHSDLSKLYEKYFANGDGKEGVFSNLLKEQKQTSFWQDFYSNWSACVLGVVSHQTERMLRGEFIHKLEQTFNITTLQNYDHLIELVDSGASIFKPREGERDPSLLVKFQEFQEDLRKLRSQASETEGESLHQ
jgi:ankyrin repeat protein